jgi:hypothetical protein
MVPGTYGEIPRIRSMGVLPVLNHISHHLEVLTTTRGMEHKHSRGTTVNLAMIIWWQYSLFGLRNPEFGRRVWAVIVSVLARC